MSDALTFTDWGGGHVSAYDHRGASQGRIAPAGVRVGGFHALVPMELRAFRVETVVDWFPTVEDAKHGLVAAHRGKQ